MKKILQSIVFKRLSWTVLFLFIYVLGSHLVLPFIDLKHPKLLGGLSNSIAFTSAMMGGNLSSFSLFSVTQNVFDLCHRSHPVFSGVSKPSD